MKSIQLILILSFLLLSCNNKSADKNDVTNADTTSVISEDGEQQYADSNEIAYESDIVTYFILVADTGENYNLLHDKMFALSKTLHLPIDTMGRYYNKSKNLIALPDNDADEMYAGSYFPRRFASSSLSLEYLSAYRHETGEKTIALVAGIFETQIIADSTLALIKPQASKSFVLKSAINIGDVH